MAEATWSVDSNREVRFQKESGGKQQSIQWRAIATGIQEVKSEKSVIIELPIQVLFRELQQATKMCCHSSRNSSRLLAFPVVSLAEALHEFRDAIS